MGRFFKKLTRWEFRRTLAAMMTAGIMEPSISFPRSRRGNEAQIKIGNRKSEIGNKLEPPHADGCESSAVVSTASCGGVSPPATTPDETSGEPAGEDARATHAARFMAALHDFNLGKLLIRACHST